MALPVAHLPETRSLLKVKKERLYMSKPDHPLCPDCYAENAGVITFCDYHAITYLGQQGKLPVSEQAAFDRITKEGQVLWSSTTSHEARALNKFVKVGFVKKNGPTTYELA